MLQKIKKIIRTKTTAMLLPRLWICKVTTDQLIFPFAIFSAYDSSNYLQIINFLKKVKKKKKS
jgi:hypothetical protein